MKADNMPDYRARLPRSSHDLSHRLGFTATVAHLLPVYHDLLNPGETVELGFDFNLRTQPLQSAAMETIDCHTEYFFVPMPLLYEPFGSTFYNIVDVFSSMYPSQNEQETVLKDLPVMDFDEGLSQVRARRNQVEEFGFEQVGASAIRLLDLMHFNPYAVSHGAGNNFNPNVFPYQIAAYHCVYEYYYRLDTRERFDNKLFNFDRYYDSSVPFGKTGFSMNWLKFFSLHYRPIANDYFTDAKVAPIVDVLNLNNKTQLATVNSWLTRSLSAVNNEPVISSGDITGTGGPSSTGNVNYWLNGKADQAIQTKFGIVHSSNGTSPVANDINTANIRAMFANEKLWSITGRARKHYDDQTLAHFGVNVPHDVKHEITCFGHDHSEIHIGEVISTSASEQAPLGEIAGKGYGSQSNRRHKFTAPVHGVVLIIQSFCPRMRYSRTYGKENALGSINDLYRPEYDNLGMQPIFGYEINYNESGVVSATEPYGWQYRYEQWKRRYDRCTLAFSSENTGREGSLNSWMLDMVPYNALVDDVAQGANTESYYGYLYSPSMLNQLMLVNYVTGVPDGDFNPSVIYDGDPFVIDSYIHSKKVSTMSDKSLPRLDA